MAITVALPFSAARFLVLQHSLMRFWRRMSIIEGSRPPVQPDPAEMAMSWTSLQPLAESVVRSEFTAFKMPSSRVFIPGNKRSQSRIIRRSPIGSAQTCDVDLREAVRRVPPGKPLQSLDCLFPNKPVLFGFVPLKEGDHLLEEVLQLSPSGDVEGIHSTLVVEMDGEPPKAGGGEGGGEEGGEGGEEGGEDGGEEGGSEDNCVNE